MADGPGYKVPHRRRREQKTDYANRLRLLKSGKPRAVIRLSNNHTTVQLVEYQRKGDETVAAAKSSHLTEYGWEHHTGNMPAAYLTGFLAGRRALEDGVNKAVIDIGLQNNQHGTRLYAALKGVVDAGIDTSVNEEVFPAEGRIRGEHIDDYRDTDIAANVDDVQEAIEDEV